jgi:ATP-dependent HslUV protease ATP-binding subunit HslU
MSGPPSFTPREIVSELDRYIVGQHKAKRAVAVALRNRWRRQAAPAELREEIMPKNILMIGPTGVGKTEIARRLAKLAQAPFVKVEASKFTEVGYVGRDVESIIRDLVEIAIGMLRDEQRKRVDARARELAEERLVALLAKPELEAVPPQVRGPFLVSSEGTVQRPGSRPKDQSELRALLRSGKLDDEMVEVEVSDAPNPLVSIFGGGHAMEDMELQLKDMLSQIPGMRGKKQKRKVKVRDARKIIEDEEAQKLIDMDSVRREAVERTEQAGIVFLDEIDKIVGPRAAQGPDVSREGVQRDLLPIVEGSTVSTKYGALKTDHVLFIAAGAFHVSKPKDLIPELQGRFPIRVELESLSDSDFVRILTEPENALTKQYTALLSTEKVTLDIRPDAVAEIARIATMVNARMENIGARRLHTIMERVLDDLAFEAPELGQVTIPITASYVRERLDGILKDEDLSQYIL